MPPSHHESDQDLVGDVCYALEGSVASCGSLLTWLISSMKIAESPEQICNFALDVENNADLVIVPAFTGLLAPYWCLDARGIIIGITRYCTNKHLCRAVLESIAMQTCDVVEAMKHDVIENTRVLKPFVKSELHLDSNSNDINNNGNDHCVDLYAYDNIIKNLKVDGGVTQSNFLCAVQSDVLNIPVYRAIMQERTALGAALAAGLGSGFYEGLNEIKELVWDGTCGIDLAVANDLKNAGVCPDIYKPDAQFSGFYEYFPAAGKRHENLPKFMRKWKVAIEKSKGWATIE
jgi:glycerol kinase